VIFNEFNQYSENLLLAQYDVSDIIQHELTKGEVREDFLIDILKSRFEPAPNFHKGTISDGNIQAGQIDIMLCRTNTEIFRLGSQAIIRPDNCLCLIEVKGNARGNDIRDFNSRISKIKNMNATHYPLCGIFCYKVNLQPKTILNRFGFAFTKKMDTWYDDGRQIVYPEIDFFVSLDERQHLFLRKKYNGRFVQLVNFPIIQNVFDLIQSLISTTPNHQPDCPASDPLHSPFRYYYLM